MNHSPDSWKRGSEDICHLLRSKVPALLQNKDSRATGLNRLQCQGAVAKFVVLRQNDPAFAAYDSQPDLVCLVELEVVIMHFDSDAVRA